MELPVKVKICGITNLKDAMAVVEAGADALGFVFYHKSPRFVKPELAKSIVEQLPPLVSTVGVFVNETTVCINDVRSFVGFDTVQLHGEEPPFYCRLWPRTIKALRVRYFEDLTLLERYQQCSCFLLDTYTPDSYGGTGQVFNWDIAVEAKRYGRVILSGGLNPDNITQAIRHVKPYAVDVSSGVESATKGIKDLTKVQDFIEKAKKALR